MARAPHPSIKHARLRAARPILCAAVLALGAGCAHAGASSSTSASSTTSAWSANAPRASLAAFRDEDELAAYHRALIEELKRKPVLSGVPIPPPVPPPLLPPGAVAPPPPPPPPTPPEPGNPVVRVVGDQLMMLWKGRPYVVHAGAAALRAEPVAMPAFAGERFSELIAADSGAEVFALGGDYRDGETRVARFGIDGGGRLAYRDGWRLRGTYETWRGDGIVPLGDGRIAFFDQREITLRDADFDATMPAVRAAGGDSAWRITAAAGGIHRPVSGLSYADDPTLHAVTVCEPGAGCRSTGVYAPRGRISHVSARAAYLWIEDYDAAQDDDYDDGAILYRIPFDGSPATALTVTGAPRDADSFLEGADGHLNALVLHDGWTKESHGRSPVPALFRLPLAEMGDGSRTAARDRYRLLPDFAGLHYNRFVGDWATYGNRPFGEYLASTGLFTEARASELGVGALRWAGSDAPAWMPLGRGVEAIEPLGSSSALVVASDGRATELALVRLDGGPRVIGRVSRSGIGHLEGRLSSIVAHRPDGADAGLIAISVGDTPEPFAWRARSIAVFRYDAGGLRQIGEMAIPGEPAGSREVAIAFAGGRVFAVLGENLVEVAEENGALREVRRIRLP